ncbi:YdcF family protein [Thiomicrorhabdus arctica]|uniref:YdcF family protein n=1 Tax=Thiomicrorhabdus arctica TaxID=131540 RepID=UPI0012FD14FF|nr:YdcF family protein [Thiomicrorhabdus arctica]
MKVYQVAKTAQPTFQHEIWILFGKQLNKNQPDTEFKQRLNTVIDWLPIEKPKCLILQGGIICKNTLSEAQAGQAYLFNSSKFISAYRDTTSLILEDRSKNTLQNLKYTREYLQQTKLPLNVTLISNRYHLLRCSVMAKNMGFSTRCLPAEKEWHLNLTQVYKILLEAFFLNWYCTGRFVSQLLNNEKILHKIR